ncbi:MAG: hypothetical protein ACTSQI_08670 [Candidatus Helarchaeota archaeon]
MENCDANGTSKNAGVKAVSIAMGGKPIVTVKVETECDEALMNPFLAAIGSFSKEILGNAKDIFFQSHNRDLYCLFKSYSTFELSIFALMDSKMEKKDIQEEAEAALDAFVEYFGEQTIANWNGDVEIFLPFQKLLEDQIAAYYKKIGNSDKDRGNLFSKLIKRLFRKKGK